MLQITGAILGSTALLAIVPIIPVFITVTSITPVVIAIIVNATKVNDKKCYWNPIIENLKFYHHHMFKVKIHQLLKDVFRQITGIHVL